MFGRHKHSYLTKLTIHKEICLVMPPVLHFNFELEIKYSTVQPRPTNIYYGDLVKNDELRTDCTGKIGKEHIYQYPLTKMLFP